MDLTQITDATTLAVINGVISSSYSAASCDTATLGSSATQVSDATCQEPSDTVRTGCLNITGSLVFTELVGLPGELYSQFFYPVEKDQQSILEFASNI